MCDNPGNLSSPKITKKKSERERLHPCSCLLSSTTTLKQNPETQETQKPTMSLTKNHLDSFWSQGTLVRVVWFDCASQHGWLIVDVSWTTESCKQRKKYMSRWSPSGLQSSSPPSAKQKQKKIPAAISCSLLVSYIGSYNYTHIWQLQRLKCVCVCVCVFLFASLVHQRNRGVKWSRNLRLTADRNLPWKTFCWMLLSSCWCQKSGQPPGMSKTNGINPLSSRGFGYLQ